MDQSTRAERRYYRLLAMSTERFERLHHRADVRAMYERLYQDGRAYALKQTVPVNPGDAGLVYAVELVSIGVDLGFIPKRSMRYWGVITPSDDLRLMAFREGLISGSLQREVQYA